MSSSEQRVEAILKVLQESGLDTSKFPKVKIELTKTLTISKGEELTLAVAMPYPIPTDKHYIDYFIDDTLIETIRDFLQSLLGKQGRNKTLIYKMAESCPPTIMNNKEIIMQLERLATTDRHLANVFINLHVWYNSSEAYKHDFIYGVSQLLEQVIVHYNRLSREYKAEARFHGKENIITVHEQNAEIDYLTIREFLHGLENHVNMLTELVKKSAELEEFGALRRREADIERQRESKALTLQFEPKK